MRKFFEAFVYFVENGIDPKLAKAANVKPDMQEVIREGAVENQDYAEAFTSFKSSTINSDTTILKPQRTGLNTGVDIQTTTRTPLLFPLYLFSFL